jgi:hypothetical protein
MLHSLTRAALRPQRCGLNRSTREGFMIARRLCLTAGMVALAALAAAQGTIPVLDVFPTTGSCRATVGQGTVSFAGRGGYLTSTDLADPAAPQLLAALCFAEQVQDVALVEQGEQLLAAVALGYRGLALVDVTDPGQPVRLGELGERQAWRLEWVAPRLYVAAASGGVVVVDVTDPMQPRISGELPVRPSHAPRALASRPGRLFVAALDDSLEVYALADPDQPLRLGGARGGNYVDLSCDGPRLAALTATGLELIDASTFSGLPLLGQWSADDPEARPHAVLMDGERVWIADRELGLHLLDASEPTAPASQELWPLASGQAWSLGRANDLVALGTTDLGVMLMAVEDGSLVERGRVTEPCPTTLDFVSGVPGALAAAGGHDATFYMPSPPAGEPVSALDFAAEAIEAIEAFAWDGDRAVVCFWMDDYPWTRLAVIGAADPAAPELLHYGHGLPTGMNDHCGKAIVEGNVAYITNRVGIRVYDLAVIDQWGPQDIGGYGVGTYHLGDFELVDQQRLCVWNADFEQLLMLDRSDLWHMTVSEILPVVSSPEAMAFHAGRLYLAEAATVSVFDVTAPGASMLLGTVEVGGYVRDLVATDAGLWVAAGAVGLERWDLGDPAAPALEAVLADQGRVETLTVAGEYVVASAPYRGLLWLGDATTPAPELPPAVALAQNRPNPFNPATTIEYTLARGGPVRLAVYDLRGRLVRVLVDGPRSEGRQWARWDGRDAAGRTVPGGVYLYRLEAEGRRWSRSMSLVK